MSLCSASRGVRIIDKKIKHGLWGDTWITLQIALVTQPQMAFRGRADSGPILRAYSKLDCARSGMIGM